MKNAMRYLRAAALPLAFLLPLGAQQSEGISRQQADEILNELRGHEAELYTRAVDILVSRVRRKLEPVAAIKTLRNAGYALALRAAESPAHG